MAWLFVPAVADSSSESGFHSEAVSAASATLNGKPLRPRIWSVLWKRASWIRRLSGMTCDPSAATNSADEFISSLADIHASRSHSLADDLDATIRGICGPKSADALARLNRQSCFSRTCQATSASDSMRSPATLKTWATRLRQASLRRRKLARATAENDSSSWATPTSSIAKGGVPQNSKGKRDLRLDVELWPTPLVPSGGRARSQEELARGGYTEDGKRHQIPLEAMAQYWPTPTISGNNNGQNHGPKSGTGLRTAAVAWPTPGASDGDKAPRAHKRGNPSLPASAETWCNPSLAEWPTPQARDCKSAHANQETLAKNARPLNEIAVQWSTPRATDGEKGGPNMTFSAGGIPLPAQAVSLQHSFPQDLASSSDGETSLLGTNPSLRLNPRFVCWLMGWPTIGRDGSVCTATEWSRYRQQLLSALSGLLSDWHLRRRGN
jgi:hypothetical protein